MAQEGTFRQECPETAGARQRKRQGGRGGWWLPKEEAGEGVQSGAHSVLHAAPWSSQQELQLSPFSWCKPLHVSLYLSGGR